MFIRCFGRLRILATVIAALATTAAAQEYPARLVRIVVPTSPAGAADNYARLIGKEMQASTNQSFIVENRPGATGLIGTEFARKAPPDGYTLLFTSNTSHVLGPLPREPRPFDAAADFTPVTKVLRYPLYLVVHPSIPARSMKEFIAFARARPGQLVYASSGQAGISHVVAELFGDAVGIKAIHAPYKGPVPALQAVVSGESHMIFNNVGLSQHLVASGRLRGYAVTGEKRSPAVPDVPTLGELGIRGMESVYTWIGLLGPANLAPAITTRLHTEVTRIMRTPEAEKRVANDGYVMVLNTPAQFRAEIQSEVDAWSKVIRTRGIKAE